MRSPHRIQKTLGELLAYLGDREAAVCRELTKIYEEIKRGKLSELKDYFGQKEPRGEFVVVIAGLDYKEKTQTECE